MRVRSKHFLVVVERGQREPLNCRRCKYTCSRLIEEDSYGS